MRTFQPPQVFCPLSCAACQLRKTGAAYTAVSGDALAFIKSFRSRALTRQAGSTLVHEQQPNGRLFTLYEGWAFRYKTLSDGRREILSFLLPRASRAWSMTTC